MVLAQLSLKFIVADNQTIFKLATKLYLNLPLNCIYDNGFKGMCLTWNLGGSGLLSCSINFVQVLSPHTVTVTVTVTVMVTSMFGLSRF